MFVISAIEFAQASINRLEWTSCGPGNECCRETTAGSTFLQKKRIVYISTRYIMFLCFLYMIAMLTDLNQGKFSTNIIILSVLLTLLMAKTNTPIWWTDQRMHEPRSEQQAEIRFKNSTFWPLLILCQCWIIIITMWYIFWCDEFVFRLLVGRHVY